MHLRIRLDLEQSKCTKLGSLLPVNIRRELGAHYRKIGILKDFLYDIRNYTKFSTGALLKRKVGATNLLAKITAAYHNIEKGLSLPNPRPGFGKDNLRLLLECISLYRGEFGSHEVIDIAVSTLRAYVAFHDALGETNYPQKSEIISVISGPHSNILCGTMKVSKNDICNVIDGVGLEFFHARHSVRQFTNDPISDEDIMFAVSAAKKAPAVCNRQFGKIYVYRDQRDIDFLLQLQGGARGFADQPRALAVLTADLTSYWGSGERNQVWIDGGLFAMSFLLGLHARGLGACCLNWSKSPSEDCSLLNFIGKTRTNVCC